jgi:hypothetical protein
MTTTATRAKDVDLGAEAFAVRAPIVQGAIDVRRSIRRPPDPFSLLDTPADGLRRTDEAFEVAESIACSVDGAQIDSSYLAGLSTAPAEDLETFKDERGRILFGSSFAAAADSQVANQIRRRPIDPANLSAYKEMDRFPNRYFAAYDQELHAILFTEAAPQLNHERVTLHELGHALTLRPAYRVAHLRVDLLHRLPREIDDLLTAYPQGADRAAIRERVLEVLAEGYAWLIVGRHRELPGAVYDAVWSLRSGAMLPSSP